MKLFPSVLLLISLGLSAGCTLDSADMSAQDIGDMTWSSNGDMVALVDNAGRSSIYGTFQNFDLYAVNTDGSIGSRISAPERSYQSYFPALFSTSDNRSAMVQLGMNIYRVDLAAKSAQQVIQNTNLLGISPDGRYVVTSQTPSTNLAKVIDVFDVTSLPARRVTKFSALGASGDKVVWLENGQFGITHGDSVGAHINVYDTTGTKVSTIPNGALSFHVSTYARGSHDLFFRDNRDQLVRQNVELGRQGYPVPGKIQSLDASQDGKLVVFATEDSSLALNMYTLNTETGAISSKLATGVVAVAISPAGDRVAYSYNDDPFHVRIKVMNITRP